MVNNNAAVNMTQPLITLFKGIGYNSWSKKMKTLFRSHDLWDLVKKGYVEEGLFAETLNDILTSLREILRFSSLSSKP